MRSFKIFPVGVEPDGRKKPLVNWKSEATDDPSIIKQWQEFFKDQIVCYGLPTGKINGLWALDVDCKDGVSGYDSLKTMGITDLPTTAWQQTPSGGMHLFFNATNPNVQYPTSVNRETKLDTRGDGGYVHIYNPNFNIPLIEAPSWVWSTTKKQKKSDLIVTDQSLVKLDPSMSIDRFNGSLDAIRGAGEGERNHTLNTHAYIVGQLVAGGALSREYAYEQLKLAALSIGLSDREAHATITSGLEGGKHNPIVHPFGNAPPELAVTIPPLPMIESPKRWTPDFATLSMLMDWSKLKKPQLFEDWSTEDIHLTSAVGGVGKTTLKLFEAVCLALGEPFLGFPCLSPGRTIMVIGEDSEAKLYAMLGRMCKQLGLMDVGQEHRLEVVRQNVVIKRASDLCLVTQDPKTRTFIPNQESLRKLYEAIDDLNPRQIVFDPIAMFWGPESGMNDMAMALAKCMQELQIYSNASIDMIAHVAKDSHTKRDLSQFSGRGGTALANHSRVIRTLIRLNEDEYFDHTGEKLENECSGILCNVSKFSDGSYLLDKPFVILRRGFVVERKEVIKTQSNTEADGESQRIFEYLKANSTEERPINLEAAADYFYVQTPRILKGKTKSYIKLLAGQGLLELVMHDNAMIGEWVRIK